MLWVPQGVAHCWEGAIKAKGKAQQKHCGAGSETFGGFTPSSAINYVAFDKPLHLSLPQFLHLKIWKQFWKLVGMQLLS